MGRYILALLAAATWAFPCGNNGRWLVKVGTDPDARVVDILQADQSDIAKLRALPKPAKYPENARIKPTEIASWQIEASITKIRLDADGDLAAVVADEDGKSMLVEFPDTACMAGSQFQEPATAARKHIEEKFPLGKSRTLTPEKPVKAVIRGVGFFDKAREPGASPNGMELHPVLWICFAGEPDCMGGE